MKAHAMTLAQRVLVTLGVSDAMLLIAHHRDKSESFTKKGPGRRHLACPVIRRNDKADVKCGTGRLRVGHDQSYRDMVISQSLRGRAEFAVWAA